MSRDRRRYLSRQYERAARCPIDVYVASAMLYQYPYKLVKPAHVTSGVVESAETVIMDSGIGDDQVDNDEVLRLSHEYDADMVVAKDYLHDQPRTTESVRRFLHKWERHECRATPLVPLQPRHADHYDDLPGHYHYLLGGMAFDYDTSEIIRAVEEFRDEVGDAPYVHLLGVGSNPRLMDFLAANPGMVQSIDCSTPEQAAMNSKIFDANLQRHDYPIRTGEGSVLTREGLAQHMAYTLCDAITKRHDSDDQRRLGAYCE